MRNNSIYINRVFLANFVASIVFIIAIYVDSIEEYLNSIVIDDTELEDLPFDVETDFSYGDFRFDYNPFFVYVGEVPLPIPDGIRDSIPQPIVKTHISSGKIYGIDDESYKYQSNEIEREYCSNIDKVVNEVAGEERIGFRYFIRFRIRPDGSVREVDIVHSDHSYAAYAPFEDTEMKSELESEMSGWQFPESGSKVTHYCWIIYNVDEVNTIGLGEGSIEEVPLPSKIK